MARTRYFYHISSDLLKNRIFGSIQNPSTDKRFAKMLHALEKALQNGGVALGPHGELHWENTELVVDQQTEGNIPPDGTDLAKLIQSIISLLHMPREVHLEGLCTLESTHSGLQRSHPGRG